jgi:hypothetical protein
MRPFLTGALLPNNIKLCWVMPSACFTQQNKRLLGTVANTKPLYRLQELPYRTQYAELKERAAAAGTLLLGTPGTLYKRTGTGHEYWYRIYYPVPNKQAEEFVGQANDEAAYKLMSDRMAYTEWMSEQVTNLRKLGYQVADKGVASVLVELHNRKLFQAGLIVVGTLAYMSWLNEYGAMAVAARTQDLDLARRQRLKLATSVSFLSSIEATHLPFTSIPRMPSHEPSTSVKLPGREGLRVDILAPGPEVGQTIQVPELEWHAQAIPYYDYMLEDSQKAAMLAGGQCIPITLPQVERMIWHKLYSSTISTRGSDKRLKDLIQAVTLAAILVEQDSVSLKQSYSAAPNALKVATLSRMSRICELLESHPEARDAFRSLESHHTRR